MLVALMQPIKAISSSGFGLVLIRCFMSGTFIKKITSCTWPYCEPCSQIHYSIMLPSIPIQYWNIQCSVSKKGFTTSSFIFPQHNRVVLHSYLLAVCYDKNGHTTLTFMNIKHTQSHSTKFIQTSCLLLTLQR